jgi:3',5'-cyclic AMP phosphodiesterase CpdA
VTVIAHLSDLHLSSVPFPTEWPWRLKPVLGWVNWKRQPGAHSDAVWEKTAAAVLAAKPDFVAVTGDLIELGLSSEYARAREALSRLGDPASVSWAPGNHDAYTTDTTARIGLALGDWLAPPPTSPRRGEVDARSAAGEGEGPVPDGALPLSRHHGADLPPPGGGEAVHPTAPGGGAGGDLRAHFPRLDVVGSAAVITLCSGTPTWTFSAEGVLGAPQLARLDALLAGLDRSSRLPVIAIHHPPHAPGLSRLKRLRDGGALLDLVARHRCPLVLHGHLHEACRREWRSGDHVVTLVGAPSASATGRHGEDGPGFNLVTVGTDLSWSVESRPVA